MLGGAEMSAWRRQWPAKVKISENGAHQWRGISSDIVAKYLQHELESRSSIGGFVGCACAVALGAIARGMLFLSLQRASFASAPLALR